MLQLFFLVIFLYLTYFYLCEYLRKRKGPPGPIPIPILGNLIQLAIASKDTAPSLALAKFAEKYGEIFQLQLGRKTMVVAASVESFRALYSAPEATGRDLSGTLADRNLHKNNLGIILSVGPHWLATRNWTFRTLKKLGMGPVTSLEALLNKQISLVLETIEDTRKRNGNIVPMFDLFVFSFFSSMWKIMVGPVTEEDIDEVKGLLEKAEITARKGVLGAGAVVAYPFLRYIFPDSTGHAAFMDFVADCNKATKKVLAKAQKKMESGGCKPETLAEEFACKMKEEKENPDTIFTENNFLTLSMDLLQAGSDTTSSYLESFILFMVLYPDVQEKLYEEICQKVGKGEKISLAHRQEMIYTQATAWEAHRHAKVTQNSVAREFTEDYYYKNCLIKKGTFMFGNLHAAHFNKDTWKDPESFRPERFIGENGQIVNHGDVCAFGFGKRVCPGEAMSHNMVFLYITTILQKYKLSAAPGKPPRAELQEGFTCKPYPFDVLFSERESNT